MEPELALAIDPLVPTAPLIASLRALGEAYPDLPVSFSTEGLGGALRRLRGGSAALAICVLLPTVPDDVSAFPLSAFCDPVIGADMRVGGGEGRARTCGGCTGRHGQARDGIPLPLLRRHLLTRRRAVFRVDGAGGVVAKRVDPAASCPGPRERRPGSAGRFLLADLRTRLAGVSWR